MRFTSLLPPALLLSLTSAIQLPNFQPFLDALPISLSDYIPSAVTNQTSLDADHEALRRRDSSSGCPNSFHNCADLGAAELCCANAAVCSADYAGHVACCPTGAACSGTIAGIITAGTVNGNGQLVGGTVGPSSAAQVTAAATTTPPGSAAAGITGSGFIVASGSTVATPGAAIRGAQIPLIARAIVRVLEFLPF